MQETLLLSLIFFPIAAAILTFFLRKAIRSYGHAARSVALIAVTALTFAATVFLLITGRGTAVQLSAENALIGISMAFDGLPAIYALVTTFMWLGAALLSPQYFRHHGISDRYAFFFLFTLGATNGVFLSTNLLSIFVFFEMMSLASYAWVAEEETVGALKAGKTYLTIAVIGGMVTLMGLFLLYHLTGTLDIAELKTLCAAAENKTELYAAAFCILFGFGAKAGMFPIHIWLPKAHPVAPAPASALLSGVLTKTGIFGILIVTVHILWGDALWGYVLLALGAVTMFLGALLAVFSINLKRTLACSSLSQIGFILVGVSMISLLGEENALAAHGTALYMVNHSIVKLVLFLTAGAIYAVAHTLNLNELRGVGRKRPVLAAIFLVGGASLAGIPGTLGYLSKTLVHEAIVEFAHHTGNPVITAVEWLFLLSGGLTAAYVTKLFVAIFVEKPTERGPQNKRRISVLSYASLLMGVVPILTLGCAPHAIAEKVAAIALPFVGGHEMHHAVHYFAWVNLKGVCISLAIAVLVYFLFIRTVLMTRDKSGNRIYADRWKEKLSMEDLLYVPVGKLLIGLLTVCARLLSDGLEPLAAVFFRIYRTLCRIFCDVPDLIVLGARQTALVPVDPPELRPKHAFCIRLGGWIDRTFHRSKAHKNTTEFLIRIVETLSEVTHKITGNFSFALLAACFGIVLILVCVALIF
ncbi:MAG: sodium:proton antiporter [Clostridia bacterium]|nr:sodium:proton antiporter [Clostridia bacterium]